MRQGVLIDQAIEGRFQLAGHLDGSTRPRAIHEAVDPLMGTAMHPWAQGSRGQLERVGNGWEALPFANGAHGVGTAEDARLFGLFHEGV
jgi:hypothetical protein